jgi:hypothetical protein
MDDRSGRLWDQVWTFVPLFIGAAIGLYFGLKIAGGNPADCGTGIPPAGTLSTAFLLGAIVVVLLIGTVVATFAARPMLSRVLFIATIGIVLASCSGVALAPATDACIDAVTPGTRVSAIGAP